MKYALLTAALLTGCATQKAALLWERETHYRTDGSVVVREGPDKLALGNLVGAGTSVLTGKPWGVLAGASVQIGESVAKVASVPADAITTGGR